jgi:RHS repeat-associated protein
MLINSAQSSVASYKYDPYGNTITSSGTLATANPFRFSSKLFDSDSALYYYGYRWYAPNLQRWLNQDPIHELGHRAVRRKRLTPVLSPWSRPDALYPFVQNNPVNSYDPVGLHAIEGVDPEAYKDCIDEAANDFKSCMCFVRDAGRKGYEGALLFEEKCSLMCLGLKHVFKIACTMGCKSLFLTQMSLVSSFVVGGAAGCVANLTASVNGCAGGTPPL